ncbi:MAG TPA: DUF1963 domain-containing protein [Gemmata sp.]
MHSSVRSYVQKRVPGIADKVLAQVRPCVSADSKKQPDDAIPPGRSKLGGAPDVPEGFEWPVHGDVPCWFIAQMNLGEAGRTWDFGLRLPRTGLLSFFYHDDGGPPGPGSRVFYFPQRGLKRIGAVVDERYKGIHDSHLYPRVLTLSEGYCIPHDLSQYNFTRVERAAAEGSKDERAAAVIGSGGYEGFDHFREMFNDRFAPHRHRFFGLPLYQTAPRGLQVLATIGQMNDRLNFYAPPAEAEALDFSGLRVTYECT